MSCLPQSESAVEWPLASEGYTLRFLYYTRWYCYRNPGHHDMWPGSLSTSKTDLFWCIVTGTALEVDIRRFSTSIIAQYVFVRSHDHQNYTQSQPHTYSLLVGEPHCWPWRSPSLSENGRLSNIPPVIPPRSMEGGRPPLGPLNTREIFLGPTNRKYCIIKEDHLYIDQNSNVAIHRMIVLTNPVLNSNILTGVNVSL